MTLRWAPVVALVWTWLLAVLAGTAAAWDARIVVLDSSQCGSVSHHELRELVALELAPRVVSAPSEVPDDAAVTRAVVTCSEASARLFVRDVARQQQQELGLDLAQIAAAARARLIALALAELIATVDMEPVAPARAEPQHEAPAAPASPAPGATAARGDWWLGAGIVREGEPRVLAPSLASGLTVSLAGLPLALLGDLALQRGERAVSAGRVTVWTVSGAPALSGQLRAGRSVLALGLGVRVGYARLVGEADAAEPAVAAHAVSGLWWGPTLGATAVLPLSARWGVRAGVDLTWVVRGVQGLDSSGAVAYRLEGLIVQATIGASLALPKLRLGRSGHQ